MPARFDHYVIVDWSAASRPTTGRDSIWVCHRGPHGERVENPPTRHLAKALLGDILAGATGRNERVVLGFDFPFGYPAGFAARLGLDGAPPWRALWDEIARLLQDDEDNANNRFELGAELNRRVSGRRFPFWGCPPKRDYPHLGPRHHNGHAADGLAEKRLIDQWMVGAQPCWKLAYTGSVGSQALTGIPVVRSLRDDPRWSGRARIWPFETGLGVPAERAAIVFAECWPSWWRGAIRTDYGPPNDRAQVRSVAELVSAGDAAGELAAWFGEGLGLTESERRIVETEEAWTLGVTAPRAPSAALRKDRRQSEADPPPQRGGGGSRSETEGAAVADASRGAPPPPSPGSSPGGAWSPSSALRGRNHLPPRNADRTYPYLGDPAAIYRRSFALIRAEADLSRFPASLRPVAMRLAHAAGDTSILDDLAWSRGAVAAGRQALGAGAPVLVDGEMLAAGIIRDRLPAANPVICTLRDPSVVKLSKAQQTTRSAAAVELWRPHLAGAVIAIGNAPTALYRLLELLAEGGGRPALVLGFPVGFVGAAEAKEALIAFGKGLQYVTLRGRRGGSAIAAAAVNALAGAKP